MKKSFMILVLAIIIVLAVAGCTTAGEKEDTGKNETPLVENVTPAENDTTALNETPEEPPAEEEAEQSVIEEEIPDKMVTDYVIEHPLDIFPDLDKRIIEVERIGNKSALRFRTGTANPAQESIYLLGLQFLVFGDIEVANSTGYNKEGKIIMSPDSRTQETRKIYWRKYHHKTDWFGDVVIPTECETDSDCDDNDNCTKDKCAEGFCSNVKIIRDECYPGL